MSTGLSTLRRRQASQSRRNPLDIGALSEASIRALSLYLSEQARFRRCPSNSRPHQGRCTSGKHLCTGRQGGDVVAGREPRPSPTPLARIVPKQLQTYLPVDPSMWLRIWPAPLRRSVTWSEIDVELVGLCVLHSWALPLIGSDKEPGKRSPLRTVPGCYTGCYIATFHSLECMAMAIKFVFEKLVGGPGFEPGASRSRTVSSACPRVSRRRRRCPAELKLPHLGV